MKKKSLLLIFSIMMLLLSACSDGKTVKTKDEAKAMVEEFYKDLLTTEPIKMESYYEDELSTVFAKDGDKMYVDQTTAGYDYYLFKENDKKYLIADDRTVFEDESMYDMTLDTLNFMVQMNLMGYFEIDDDTTTFKATNKDDNELTLVVNMKDEGDKDFTITTIGKKTDGKITEMTSEMNYDGQVSKSSYKFTYGESIVLPEYTMPVTYDNMPHVDSPYKTFGEIIDKYSEEDYLMTMFEDNKFYVIDSLDNRHYQFSATVSEYLINEYSNLDAMADDYTQKFHDLVRDIEIEDCIDFTDALPSQETLDSYKDKTIEALVNDGYEVSGYSFWEDDNYIFASKDLMSYRVGVIPEEGFDLEGEFEYEDLYNFTIKDIEFTEPEYSALPMK